MYYLIAVNQQRGLLQTRKDTNNSNKLTDQMQQFHKFIT